MSAGALTRRRFVQAPGASGLTVPGGSAAPESRLLYPYGAIHMSTISHWQHYLPPVEEWVAYLEKDVIRMKAVEFNTLVAHLDWYDIETAPGRFNFERVDRMIDIVEKHGMKALLWPWPELQPEWVVKAYPASEWIASDGYRAGVACWDHPEVRSLHEQFVEKTVARYKDRRCVLGWDIGAEAGIWASGISIPIDQPPQVKLYCYCDFTARRYRAWLQRKYRTIAKLNEVWATHYHDWEQIEPIRSGVFERAQIFWLDWREFMLWNTTEFQALKAKAAKRSDSNHPLTAHIGSWGAGYVYHAADEYHIAKHIDTLALSLFPFWMRRSSGYYKPGHGALALDGILSAADGKPMWVEELQGGPSIWGLAYRSPTPRPEDIRLWAWQCVAHGARGIFYWNWRPETTGIEASGFGLANYDGSLTPRVRAAGDVSAILQKYAALFLKARPARAEAAFFHSPRTSILATGEGDESSYRLSVRGLYMALWKSGLPVDILVREQLLSRDLSRYKVIYLPFAYTLSLDEGARLKEYVSRGGTLYAETWCGLKDERTFLYETVPGAGMAEVLQCKETSTEPAERGSLKVVRQSAWMKLSPGTLLPVHKYQEVLETLPGAVVLAAFEDGAPAIIAGEYGKGRTLYAATMLCRSYDLKPETAVRQLLAGLAEASGVIPPVRLEGVPEDSEIEARVLECEDAKRMVIFLNHGPNRARMATRFKGREASDLLVGGRVALDTSDGFAKADIELSPYEVKVLLIGA